jgi:hypothetical protein
MVFHEFQATETFTKTRVETRENTNTTTSKSDWRFTSSTIRDKYGNSIGSQSGYIPGEKTTHYETTTQHIPITETINLTVFMCPACRSKKAFSLDYKFAICHPEERSAADEVPGESVLGKVRAYLDKISSDYNLAMCYPEVCGFVHQYDRSLPTCPICELIQDSVIKARSQLSSFKGLDYDPQVTQALHNAIKQLFSEVHTQGRGNKGSPPTPPKGSPPKILPLVAPPRIPPQVPPN